MIDKKSIVKHFEGLHQIECQETKQAIPQTMRGKKIRAILKLIRDI